MHNSLQEWIFTVLLLLDPIGSLVCLYNVSNVRKELNILLGCGKVVNDLTFETLNFLIS